MSDLEAIAARSQKKHLSKKIKKRCRVRESTMAYLSNNFMSTLYKQFVHNKTDGTSNFGQDTKEPVPEESVGINDGSGSFYLLTSTHMSVIIVLSFILFTGVVGNLALVFVSSRMKRKFRILINQFKLLCGINVVASFFVPTLLLYQVINHYQRWEFGSFGCKIVPSFNQFQSLFLNVSAS